MPGPRAGPHELPPPGATADEIHRAAERVLARPEFDEPRRSLYQRVLDRIGEVIADVFGALSGGGATGLAAWFALVLMMLGAGYMVLRGLRLDRSRTGRGPEEALTVDTGRPATDWEAEAAALEARGEWRPALRCRHRALVARLARTGVVEEVPGRTAGEYRALMDRVAPVSAVPFAGATDLFERAWYGDQPTGPDESSEFSRLAERVLEGPPR